MLAGPAGVGGRYWTLQERAASRASLTAAVRDRHAHRGGGGGGGEGAGVEAAAREDRERCAGATGVPMSSSGSSSGVDGAMSGVRRVEPKKDK